MVIARQSERLLDIRTIRRNIRGGILTREKYEEHLRSLPDVADNAAPLGSSDEDRQTRTYTSPTPSFPRRTDAPLYTDADLSEEDFEDDDDDDLIVGAAPVAAPVSPAAPVPPVAAPVPPPVAAPVPPPVAEPAVVAPITAEPVEPVEVAPEVIEPAAVEPVVVEPVVSAPEDDETQG